VSDGASVASYRSHYKAHTGVSYGFAVMFNLIFVTQFWGRGAPRGSAMVPLGRDLVSSHRLPIQTTLVSGIVWPQFTMQVLTGRCQPPVWVCEKGWYAYAAGDMCPLSPGTTSYRLLIVRSISHHFRSALDVPDRRRSESGRIGLAKGGTVH